MKRSPWLILACLVVLLVGCSTPGVETGRTEQALGSTPEAASATPSPTNTSAPPTGEATATSKPPSIIEGSPADVLSPTAQEPAVASPPPLTATSTATSPPAAPSATPVAVLTANDIQRISPAEAKALLDGGTAVLYDVRSENEYRALHAADAISFPEADTIARFSELPADKSLIFY